MKTSHFFVASFGTFVVHIAIAYALFVGSVLLPKAAAKEVVVTEISFLDEPQPPLIKEEIKQEIPQKPEPIVEKKPEKKVQKEHAKVTPLQKQIVEPIATQVPSQEPLVEPTTASQTPTTNTQEPKHKVTSPHSDDLLLIYLTKVRTKIQKSLHYPAMARKMGIEGEAVVQFMIHTNGMVDASSIKIAKSSGKAILDRNAIDAVLEALPFESPPHEEIEIKVPVVFKLTS